MEKMVVGKWPFSDIHHIGAIVRDVDKTAAYYESLGIGSFKPLIIDVQDQRVRGRLANDLELKVKMWNIGPIKVELIEPVAGKESIWKEVLERRGEGIHHLAFRIDNIEKAKAELIEKGFNLIFSAEMKPGGSCAYFETGRIGSLVFELFQPPKG